MKLLAEEDLFNINTNNLSEELIASHFEDYFNLILDFNNKAYDNGSGYVLSILNIRKKESSVLKSIKSLINFNISELFGYSDRVYSQLKNQTFQGSASTMERVNTNINNVLSEGYRTGLGNKEIGKNIQKEFKGLKTHEATRIATTEVNGAQSLGAYEQYFVDNQEYHQWLSAGDSRTRLTHSELDGEIVKVGTPFSNGLLYPGDRNGPIKEWIRCRCTTVPWICPYGMMVPPGMVKFRESDLIPMVDGANDNIIPQKKPTSEYPEGFDKLNPIEQGEYKGYLKLIDEGKMDKDNGLIQMLKDKMDDLVRRSKPLDPLKNKKYKDIKELNKLGSRIKPKEDYIARHFDDSTFVIRKTTNKNVQKKLSYEDIIKEYDKWPDRLKINVDGVNISQHSYKRGNSFVAGYVKNGEREVHLLKTPIGKRETIKTLRHEVGHILDNFTSKGVHEKHQYSASKDYIKAIKKDNKLNGSNFPTQYAKDSFNNSGKYSEDFAESVKFVISKDKTFLKNYPNRAKYIKKILNIK